MGKLMIKRVPSSWCELRIDTRQYIENLKEMKKLAGPKRRICAVLKGDAYGHGCVQMSKVAWESGLVDMIGICDNDEIYQIREGLDQDIPLLRLRPALMEEVEATLDLNVEEPLCSYESVDSLRTLIRTYNQRYDAERVLKVHIEIDCGIGRCGFLPTEETLTQLEKISKMSEFQIAGVFAHCPHTSISKIKPIHQIFESFKARIMERLPLKNCIFHFANSACTLAGIGLHDMIRIGQSTYGFNSLDDHSNDSLTSFHEGKFPIPPCIRPLIQFVSKVVLVRELPEYSAIGYGSHYRVGKEKALIATIPIGFHQGFPRDLIFSAPEAVARTGKAMPHPFVLINGVKCPLLGTGSMNMLCCDVTGLVEEPSALIGSEVILIGKQGDCEVSIFDFAEWFDRGVAALRSHQLGILNGERRVWI